MSVGFSYNLFAYLTLEGLLLSDPLVEVRDAQQMHLLLRGVRLSRLLTSKVRTIFLGTLLYTSHCRVGSFSAVSVKNACGLVCHAFLKTILK